MLNARFYSSLVGNFTAPQPTTQPKKQHARATMNFSSLRTNPQRPCCLPPRQHPLQTQLRAQHLQRALIKVSFTGRGRATSTLLVAAVKIEPHKKKENIGHTLHVLLLSSYASKPSHAPSDGITASIDATSSTPPADIYRPTIASPALHAVGVVEEK